jgi:hypothetical protein
LDAKTLNVPQPICIFAVKLLIPNRFPASIAGMLSRPAR